MKRAIQKFVEDPLAEELLLGHFKVGDKIIAKHKKSSEELFFVNDSKVETEEHDNQGKKSV